MAGGTVSSLLAPLGSSLVRGFAFLLKDKDKNRKGRPVAIPSCLVCFKKLVEVRQLEPSVRKIGETLF